MFPKTLFAVFLTLLIFPSAANAQSYTKTTFSSTYVELSSPTVIWNGAAGTYDDTYTDVSIGFTFNYYGKNYNTVRVSTNGYITLYDTSQSPGSAAGTDASNDPIPSTADPDNYLAPWWDDIIVRNQGAVPDKVQYKTSGSAGSRVFTVEYYSVSGYYDNKGTWLYFQVKLYETTNVIEFRYYDGSYLDYIPTATIGIENSDGTAGVGGPKNDGTTSSWPSVNYRFTPLQPDLIVEDIWVDPSPPLFGKSSNITWRIKNQGSGNAAGTFRTKFYFDGVYKAYADTSGLAVGSTAAYYWPMTWPSDTNQHIVKVVVDTDSAITESNEGNNERSESFSGIVGTVTVSGYLHYRNDSGGQQPIRHAKVEFYNKNIFADDYLGETYTDGNGLYSFPPVNNQETRFGEFGTLDIYVKVYAENASVSSVKEPGIFSDTVYTYSTTPQWDVKNGPLPVSDTVANGKQGAYNIFNSIVQAYNFLESNVYDNANDLDGDGTTNDRWNQPKIDIFWPNNGTAFYGNYYINISNDDEWDEDAVQHEYGHAVMWKLYRNNTPPTNYFGKHNIGTESDGGFALIEGWAEFIPSAVQNSASYRDVYDLESDSFEDWVSYGNMDGDIVEGAVAATLWDITDDTSSEDSAPGSDDDGVPKQYVKLWNVMRDHRPGDIHAFWNGWFDAGHNYGYRKEMNSIFWDHGIDNNNAPTVTSLDQTPTVIYRTLTFRVYAHYSDVETPEGSLTSTIEYQMPANTVWNGCTELWDSGNHRWYCDITTTASDNQLGTWSFRAKAGDGMEESGWTYDFNTVTVLNNNPAVASLDKSAASLYRIQGFMIYMHGSDTEDSESSLTQRIQYQLPGNTGWNDCAESWDAANHRWYCTVTTTTADSQLGTWDIRGMFTDTDAGESSWTTQNDAITVSNNNPSISGIPDKSTDEDTTPPDNWIDLHNYASDAEDGDSSMTYTIISETNAALIDCSIVSNRYVDCGTPAQDQYGYSDVTVRTSDTDGGTSSDTFRVTVNPVDDLPPKKSPGELCNANGECTTSYCHGSASNAKRCCSSKPADDGWYGGGDAGCGVLDDPPSQYRDYYCTSAGAAAYEATDTKDCDSQDTNICSLSNLEQRDYYVQTNTNTCTYCSQTYEPDQSQTACTSCAGKKWGIGGETSVTTCCGDDANEFPIGYVYCTGGSCSAGDEIGSACCSRNESCVYGKTCYPDSFVGDVNDDNKNEKCDSGTWREISANYIVPRKKIGIGHGSSKNSSANYNTETTVGRGPVGRNTSSNYMIEIGYNQYFG
ncbi:MAG: hypothetical protein HYW26_00005 [Candidatus Aenigmarchaeota archaeon]|nr:hypothetical protein [Candidatus Aenigmarchaeota archaeon]